MKLIVLFCSFFLLTSCGSKAVRYHPETLAKISRPVIILIPGYYGSALADKETGERYFLSAWGATFSNTPLALVEPDLGVVGARPLREDGMLSHVRVVPGIFSVNVYGEALRFLTDKFGEIAEIVPFSYDWRQDLSHGAEGLDDLVRKLKSRGAPRILIVSHSMGGLVAAQYLSRPDLKSAKEINAVIIAGTPFSGAMSAFRNLQHGTALGLSKIPLSYESLGTFPSMYELVPQAESGAYLSSTGAPLDNEALSPAFWKRIQYGFFRARPDLAKATQEKREDFVVKSLETARRFSQTLRVTGKADSAPAMLYFVGIGLPTFSRAMWSQKNLSEKGYWLFDDEAVKKHFPNRDLVSLNEDGDNTVSARSATPPAGLLSRLPGKVVQVTARHEEMFGNETLLALTEAFLKEHLK